MDDHPEATDQDADRDLQDKIDEQTARAWTALADVLDDYEPERG